MEKYSQELESKEVALGTNENMFVREYPTSNFKVYDLFVS
jgi:hypothetical protein